MKRIGVVIADDSDKMRELIKDVISSDPRLEVVGMAENGQKACALVRQKKPDILLLDLIMPELDGLSVLERLAGAPDIPQSLRVIVISAVSSEHIIQDVFKKGACYYFIKPFDSAALVDRIKLLACEQDDIKRTPRTGGITEEKSGQHLCDMEKAVSDLFHRLGIPAHLKGYQYLKDAVLLILSRKDRFYSITKDVYPFVAKKYDANASQVERAMRHAIETGWSRGDLDTIDALFGYTVRNESGKPTNSEFLALIANRLRAEFFK